MSGDGLRFGLLGPLAVVRDGEPVPFAGTLRRALLALLVLHAREPLTSDRLADELWNGRPPATARTALQMHIRAIRQALGPELPLRTVPGGYVLDIPPDASDIGEFERRTAAAQRAGDAAVALRELTEALRLWRGPALADLPSAQADAARLEELRLTALEARIDAQLALGGHADAVAELGPLVAEQPYRERLRAQLMLALYRCGRQADALAAYQQARDTLVDELGLDPGDELQRLQQAILAHDPGLAAPPAAPPAEEAPPARRERKTVTTLLAALEIDADPEDADALLTAARDRLIEEVERHGGTVRGHPAGMVLAVFGFPTAHEDDAERAVRAALAIRDHAGAAVRVSVTTREALVGEDTDGAGTPLLPGIGPVVVDDRTRTATQRTIEYRGDAGAWEAVAVRAGIHDAPPSRTPLVGRRRELGLLRDAAERVRATESPALVTVVGEPGVGKTRLVHELADPDARFLYGRSLPYGEGVSFWALGEMVKSLAGILETDAPDEAAAKLADRVAALVPDGGETEWVLRHAGGLVGAAGEEAAAGDARRGQEFAAWRRLLEAVAAEQPLVLTFEDVHWADDGLLDFVDQLTDWATGSPILVLATARPELLERRPGWGGGKRDSTTISLAPLSDAETVELIGELAGGALDAAESDRLAERCGGNPLFAEQYVEMRSGGDTAVPDTVRAVIQARLDALPAAEKHLLQDAAVVGQVFWPGAIADGEARLLTLGRRQLVRRARGSSVAGQPQYSFVHALVRDVAYEQIPRAERVDKHVRTAAWIEGLGRPEDHAELLGHHYEQALTLAQAAGTDLGAVVPRARSALALAGERAHALYAFDAAERFYADALALWPEDAHDERADLIYRRALAVWERGEAGRGEVLERAVDALSALGDDLRVADLEQLLSDVWWVAGENDRSRTHLNRAWELVAEAAPSPVKARVLAQIVRLDMLAARYDADRTRAALDITAALGLGELRAHVLISAGTARADVGDDAGFDLIAQGLAAAQAENWLWAIDRAATNRSTQLTFRGRAREALASLLAGGPAVDRMGSRVERRLHRANLIEQWVESGDWQRALPAAGEFLAEEEATLSYSGASVACDRATMRLGGGDLDGAVADQARALERARAAKDPQALYRALGVAVHAHADTGRLDTARARFDELLVDPVAFRFLGFVAGDVAWAATKIDRVEPARRALSVAAYPSLYAGRAIVDGDFARAAAIYDEQGAARSAALARLRGGLDDGARAFFARIGATRYAQL